MFDDRKSIDAIVYFFNFSSPKGALQSGLIPPWTHSMAWSPDICQVDQCTGLFTRSSTAIPSSSLACALTAYP